MCRELSYSADDIRFDLDKEPRVTLRDSRDIITIDIDRVGAGFRAIINGSEIELPEGIRTMEEARKAAVEIAIAEVAIAAKQLIDQNFE
jgi:hypothetical protein